MTVDITAPDVNHAARAVKVSKIYGEGDAAVRALDSVTVGFPTGRFTASYQNVDLAQVSDFYRFDGIRFAGRATGSNVLEWPMGRFSEHRGEGRITAIPPAGAAPMMASLADARAADPGHTRH